VCKKEKEVDVFNFYKASRDYGDGFDTVCRDCVLMRARVRRGK
jgi:hypothetical protein